MAMEVNFIPNWMENQDSGTWCPQKIRVKEAWIPQKTKIKIVHLPNPPSICQLPCSECGT